MEDTQKTALEAPASELNPTPVNTAPAAAPTAAPEEELIDISVFAKVKFRVGKIEAAELLPKSKKLLKLQVDLGPKLGKRQILSGIAKHYTPETLIGKRIVVVANLKPATMMGEQSAGMLLAASNADDSVLAILEPADAIELGSEVR